MKVELNKEELISASEVGAFLFCKMSFLLKRANIIPEEDEEVKDKLKLIEVGRVQHQGIAKKSKEIIKKETLAKSIYTIGILTIILGILILILFL